MKNEPRVSCMPENKGMFPPTRKKKKKKQQQHGGRHTSKGHRNQAERFLK